jgi:hypothetical protein
MKNINYLKEHVDKLAALLAEPKLLSTSWREDFRKELSAVGRFQKYGYSIAGSTDRRILNDPVGSKYLCKGCGERFKSEGRGLDFSMWCGTVGCEFYDHTVPLNDRPI